MRVYFGWTRSQRTKCTSLFALAIKAMHAVQCRVRVNAKLYYAHYSSMALNDVGRNIESDSRKGKQIKQRINND